MLLSLCFSGAAFEFVWPECSNLLACIDCFEFFGLSTACV